MEESRIRVTHTFSGDCLMNKKRRCFGGETHICKYFVYI